MDDVKLNTYNKKHYEDLPAFVGRFSTDISMKFSIENSNGRWVKI